MFKRLVKAVKGFFGTMSDETSYVEVKQQEQHFVRLGTSDKIKAVLEDIAKEKQRIKTLQDSFLAWKENNRRVFAC
jgi:hypothetical protein